MRVGPWAFFTACIMCFAAISNRLMPIQQPLNVVSVMNGLASPRDWRPSFNRSNACPKGTGPHPTCNVSISAGLRTQQVRNKIADTVKQRFPHFSKDAAKTFSLYPYLEAEAFRTRQRIAAEWLTEIGAQSILDIGAYYNDMRQFLRHCPRHLTIVEPILDDEAYTSTCLQRNTSVAVVTQTFQEFLAETWRSWPVKFDTVVCIGCDSRFGPTAKELNTVSSRFIVVEYAEGDGPSRKQYSRMKGNVLREMLYTIRDANATQFNVRKMLLIETDHK
jgi:hypothetical protein